MLTNRRLFLGRIGALAAVTAGSISISGCMSGSATSNSSSRPPPAQMMGRLSAGFNWAVVNLSNDSAYASFRIDTATTLRRMEADVSLLPTTNPAGGGGRVQALCRAWVSRGRAPTLNSAHATSDNATTVAQDFGPISIRNSSDLAVKNTVAVLQDMWYSSTLRSWVPTNGKASADTKSVVTQPQLALNVGDYLVFGIDHVGLPSAVQIQAILEYYQS